MRNTKVFALICVLGVSLVLGCAEQPRYLGPSSDHFDGLRFFNQLPARKSLLSVAKFVLASPFKKDQWPRWLEAQPWPLPAPIEAGIKATYINHSTVLLQFPGLNVLTDPIWSERASPFSFAGPKRVRDPGVALADLPPIDVIVISHDHYDHLDIETLKLLRRHGRSGPPLILIGLGNAGLLDKHGIENYRELDWWQSVVHNDVELTFVEVRHGSGRGLGDQMKSLWGGFVVRSEHGQVYFAGDTGFGPHFAETHRRYGEFDLSLLPIGAYRPRDFMAPVHLNPADAVLAHQQLVSRQSVAIHHGTFQLTYEAIDEPYRELDVALQQAKLPVSAFRVLGFGESLQVHSKQHRRGQWSP